MGRPDTENVAVHAPALARLGIVYADEIRMKIVTEAYMREISPKQFHAEFGGGSVPRVAQHFERLVEFGWLTLVSTKTGGVRRGAVEHFYRATELVIFEADMWAALPASMRAAFTWTTFEQLTERVGEAIVAGTFNAREDRHLSWTPLLLDEVGWERVTGAADVVFRTMLEEHDHAKMRLRSGGRSGLATIAMAVFESPIWLRRSEEEQVCLSNHLGGSGGRFNRALFFPRFSRVLTNPVDLQIIEKLNSREMSAKLLHAEMPAVTLSAFDRRLKKLSEQGWAIEVDSKTGGNRRRAVEHFYRAVTPAFVDNESWADIPDVVKATITPRTYEQLREKVKEAVDTGTFDARVDRHLTWSILRFDETGWARVTTLVGNFFGALLDEERAAKARMTQTGEDPILTTVGLAAFESPGDSVKAP